jgi:dTDP-4-amino-4,6-dideoxygalactose transaminase
MPQARSLIRASIPVYRPRLPDADRLLPYLRRIDDARIYTNWGPLATELETRLARHFGLPDHAVVSASSGTSALVGAILAGAGRATPERPLALLPAFTFVATAVAVEHCGYRPHLVDVEPGDWAVCLDRLVSHPRIDEVGLAIVVAPFGRTVAQDACFRFRERTGIPVVIDGGASFEGVSDAPSRALGSVPTALSFHATKSFSTGEGGAVVTTDERLSATVVRALNFGFHASRNSEAPSTNGKMSEYQAAIGLAELDGWRDKRQALLGAAQRYRDAFASLDLRQALVTAPDIASCYALFEAGTTLISGRLQGDLADSRIDCRLWYGRGVHGQQYFRSVSRDGLAVTEDLLPRLVGLPMAPDITDEAIARTADVVASALQAVPAT